MRTCEHCNIQHSGPYLKYCKNCYQGFKIYGTNWVKKEKYKKRDRLGTKCEKCEKVRVKELDIEDKLCRRCYLNSLDGYKEKQKKRTRDYQRKKRGIDPELPLLIAPSGSGSIKKDQGYKVICKKEFIGMPHADKKGRIAEHTYIMMKHLGRPLKKGENIHHKNGIRNDNRIENLELWNRSQPPGQRLEEKIDWCIKFLTQYGYIITKGVS